MQFHTQKCLYMLSQFASLYHCIVLLVFSLGCIHAYSMCTILIFLYYFQKAVNVIGQIKLRGVSACGAAWQRCVTFRECTGDEGRAGGMDSCSKADCAGWLSYQGSSHASKSQIKHPHLSFQPAALLQVPAPLSLSLPPCVTVLSVDYQTLKQSRGSDRLPTEW